MTVRLFHYVHCPYCVRVRLALGFLGTSWESQVLSYDDEVTPVKLTGKKMLPIALIDDVPMNESLDIIRRLDTTGALAPNVDATVEAFLARAS
ncbi:MAG: glutathione S-transferase N-terminal domain-containing protein, partial [Bacteriovoracia bacterium]